MYLVCIALRCDFACSPLALPTTYFLSDPHIVCGLMMKSMTEYNLLADSESAHWPRTMRGTETKVALSIENPMGIDENHFDVATNYLDKWIQTTCARGNRSNEFHTESVCRCCLISCVEVVCNYDRVVHRALSLYCSRWTAY